MMSAQEDREKLEYLHSKLSLLNCNLYRKNGLYEYKDVVEEAMDMLLEQQAKIEKLEGFRNAVRSFVGLEER